MDYEKESMIDFLHEIHQLVQRVKIHLVMVVDEWIDLAHLL